MLAAALGPGPAGAVELEKLVMPGPVIEGHAEIESECGRCHAPFRAEAQDALCLDCHEEVGEDRRTGAGFHGRAPGASTAACRDCHGEHRGRDADVVGLDPTAFDHGLTDFPLRGAHGRTACDACHAADEPHREAESACAACHREDDPHLGRLGPSCADCHTETDWREARFDHGTTDFALEGRHRDVACGACHPAQRYEGTATDCAACHRQDDIHRGRFGAACGDCHHPKGWSAVRFDHGRDTRFPLRGSHASARCEACHGDSLEKLATDCVSCHREDDVHRGRNGTDCERCHREDRWATEIFDHDRMTEFPLKGAHRSASCERCHVGPVDQHELDTACVACHREDDVHAGQQGERCAECHDEVGWTHRVFFDHDLTAFPLLGMHAVAACEQCHATSRFKDTPHACNECHAGDDIHRGRLGPDCARCHNPNAWNLWRFDHATQTSFPLRGAHESLDCHACHRGAADAGFALATSCFSCHSDDDRHHGGFGRDCGRCHGDLSWRDVRIGR
jgi:hypothetical protein